MSKHLKRLDAPRSWGVSRKVSSWVTKPRPGAHPIEASVPMMIVVRDMLELCDNSREAKYLLGTREIMVDGRVITDHKFPIGFMDIVTVKKTGESYRMLLDAHSNFKLTPVAPEEAKSKLGRIEDKKTVSGGKVQLNLHDGRNILLDNNQYSTGDVLKIELPTQKILKSLQLAEGKLALLIGGSHPGELVTVKSFEMKRGSAQNLVLFKEGFATVREHVFVVGDKSPEIKLLEASAV